MSAFSSIFKRNSVSNSSPKSSNSNSRPTSPESPKNPFIVKRKQKDSISTSPSSSSSLDQQLKARASSSNPVPVGSAPSSLGPLDSTSLILPSIDVQSPSPKLESPLKEFDSQDSNKSKYFPEDSNPKLTSEPTSTSSNSNSFNPNEMAKRPNTSSSSQQQQSSNPNSPITTNSSKEKPIRRGSRHAQDDSQAGTAAPNRHELMRRAMAEAMMSGNGNDDPKVVSNDSHSASGGVGMSHSISGPSALSGAGSNLNSTPSNRRPSSSGAVAGNSISKTNGSSNQEQAGGGGGGGGEENGNSSTTASTSQFDKPGEGSLTIDAFSADGTDTALVEGAPQPLIWPSSSASASASTSNFPPNHSTPRRPELGSRNSSFSGPSGGNQSNNKVNSNLNETVSTPKNESGGGAFNNSKSSASPSHHQRYATTMTSVDPRTAIGKSASLAPPVLSNGIGPNLSSSTNASSSSPTSTRTQGMSESNSTSALLSAPTSPGALSRFRRNSNSDIHEASSSKKKEKKEKEKEVGGIASALALGMNGMAGVGANGAALQAASQHVNSKMSGSNSPIRRKSTNGDGSNQGGICRDPSSGTIVERDDQGNDFHHHIMLGKDNNRRDRSTSSTSSFGNGSISGYSTSSGLGAAAGFGSIIGGNSNTYLDPTSINTIGGGGRPGISRSSSSNSLSNKFDPRRLTPDGIGAVGGLSPSGMGEHVGILEGDFIGSTGTVGGFHSTGNRNRSNSDLGHGAGGGNMNNNNNAWDQDLGMGGQITGFAVASSKRNSDFHALFSAVPEDDYLIEDYGCATVREILIQGRIYISENHVCFHANIFGWVTNVVIPFSDIVSIEKRMTAFVIPNAIQIATLHSKHTFASFLSRDTTYDLIVNIWKLSHPEINLSAADQLEFSEDEEDEEEAAADEEEGCKKKSKKSKLKKLLAAKEKLGAQGADDDAGGDDSNAKAAAGISPSKSPGPGGKKAPHRKTECACSKEKKHCNTIVLDTTYPAVPEKIYNLLFTTGFIKEFWTENQKLMDLQMSDWSPSADSKQQLSRNITYIKPLAGGFGPKQTKCLLTDENDHVEFDDYVTVLTTTRTPDVPSGGSFSVKTRTCFTWAGGNVTRMFVSCDVNWTGRSMIKGIIDKACIDGQKTYYKDLDLAMRAYLKEHASEFKEEGDDPAAVEEIAAAAGETSQDDSKKESESKAGTSSDSNDQPEGILGQVVSIAKMAGGLVTDGVGMLSETLSGASPSALIVGAIIALLVISNLWTLSYGNSSSPSRDLNSSNSNSARNQRNNLIKAKSDPYHQDGNSPESIALAVRDVLKEFLDPVKNSNHQPVSSSIVQDQLLDPVTEARELLKLLDNAESRISRLRDSLKGIEVAKDRAGKVEL